MVMINLMAAASKHNVKTECHTQKTLPGKNYELLYSVHVHLQIAQVSNNVKNINLDMECALYDLFNY